MCSWALRDWAHFTEHREPRVSIQTTSLAGQGNLIYKEEFVCLSVCLSVSVSSRHAHISACIDLMFHIQSHSGTGKVFTCVPTHTSFHIYQRNYTNTNSGDDSDLSIFPLPTTWMYHTSVALQQHRLSMAQLLATFFFFF